MAKARRGRTLAPGPVADDTSATWPAWLPRRLLDVEDIAELFHISTRTARRMVDSGELPRVPFGRLVRVHPEDLLQLLDHGPQAKYRNKKSSRTTAADTS